MKKQSVTISEIARLAGVNVSTVSRTINHPEMVDEKTRQKVMYYVRQFNYRPNPFARGLQTRRSQIVALVVPNYTNLSFANLSRGVQEGLRLTDNAMVIFSSRESEKWERRVCREVANLHIDGVIFASASSMMPPLEELQEHTAKLLIDRDGSDRGIDSLLFDFKRGFIDAVGYFKEYGHKKIALIAGDLKSYTGMEKKEAFLNALRHHDLPSDDRCIVDTFWSAEAGWTGTEQLLKTDCRPTAIIAATDTLAKGVVGALAFHGLKVPQDMSVVGMNDEPDSGFLNPPLTTMRFNDYGMGMDAARLIMRRISDPESSMIMTHYPLEIVERATVGKAKG